MPDISSPIKERLAYESDLPEATQVAYHAVVHLLIPCVDPFGIAIDDESAAMEYVSETLRDNFLDWGYVVAIDPDTGEALEGDGLETKQTPIAVTVCAPYVEGSFLEFEE
jgi:hypothetical protein